MIAQENEYLSSTIELAYLSNKDKNIIKVARERQDFLSMQAYKDKKLASQATEIKDLKGTVSSQADEINVLTDTVSSQADEINVLTDTVSSQADEINVLADTVSSQADEIRRLKKLLNDNGITS